MSHSLCETLRVSGLLALRNCVRMTDILPILLQARNGKRKFETFSRSSGYLGPDAAVPAHQRRASGHPGLLPDGRFLRALLRRRGEGLTPARPYPDPARRVGR